MLLQHARFAGDVLSAPTALQAHSHTHCLHFLLQAICLTVCISLFVCLLLQDLLENDSLHNGTDASGNPILADIGTFLKKELKGTFKDADIKYIDPSYIIRSIPTTSNDRIYCKILAHNAVHAAFAGYTGITVGLVNTHYVYLPIPVIIQAARKVDPRGKMWNRLRASIGQPNFF
jgi:6-phosphofructokinase 1